MGLQEDVDAGIAEAEAVADARRELRYGPLLAALERLMEAITLSSKEYPEPPREYRRDVIRELAALLESPTGNPGI